MPDSADGASRGGAAGLRGWVPGRNPSRSNPRANRPRTWPALSVNSWPVLNRSEPIVTSPSATNVEIHGQDLVNSPGRAAARPARIASAISWYSRWVSAGLVSARQNASSSAIRCGSFW